MRALIEYYTSRSKDNILQATVDLSDWGQGSAGLAKETTANFTVTTSYYYMLRVMSEIAEALQYRDDAVRYDSLANKVQISFNAKYYNSSTGTYEYGNQAEYAMPLYYGLVMPENELAVASKLADSVVRSGYKIKTGEIGLKPVLMMLAKYGYNDIVYQMANQTDYPSYGYWVKQGATTTPEYWNMNFSQNHCMMNHIEEWFYSQLGGITNAGIAYDSICISPYMPSDLSEMSAIVGSPYGSIVSEYSVLSEGTTYHFVVPENTIATISLPLSVQFDLYENGKVLSSDTPGIHSLEHKSEGIIITVGSGDYYFTTGNRDL